jgi:hypothetical protein
VSGFGERGGEELWCQSQEGQELSVPAAADQLILKMISEHQTVDHRNAAQEQTNFENSAEKANVFAHTLD